MRCPGLSISRGNILDPLVLLVDLLLRLIEGHRLHHVIAVVSEPAAGLDAIRRAGGGLIRNLLVRRCRSSRKVLFGVVGRATRHENRTVGRQIQIVKCIHFSIRWVLRSSKYISYRLLFLIMIISLSLFKYVFRLRRHFRQQG